MDRIKGRLGRAVVVFLPVWLVLLFLLPFSGMGALACMTLATLLALAPVIWLDRRRGRRPAAEAAAGDAPRPAAGKRPMSPLAAAAYTLGGVVVLAYVLFIIVTAAKG